ncbi:MAG: GNAT family N-acetyltransferase [Pseudomonadota bacterium]
MDDIVSRPYRADDLFACLALFESNVGVFFAPEERADFCETLDSVNASERPYLTLARDGAVIACGGLIIDADARRASLAWGMVGRALHGRGLGTRLTEARLALARAAPDVDEVTLATSQHTQGFYARFGFTVSDVAADGFAPGLDRWDMVLKLV